MPGYDRMGPGGEGPMTGGGRGYCGPGSERGNIPFIPRGAGRGFPPRGGGRGRAFGGGRGRGYGSSMNQLYDVNQELDVREGSTLEKVVKALGEVMNSAKEILKSSKEIMSDYKKIREESKE
ncbi:hypothetical protein AYK26_06730 [Euryarchaeota archaeon SM23-78]|nr:MAG: hypothetical protein AYK26_06730 [Euryarchaeota archaeon SM23-78]MBW3001187.1 DUF5320 family protein [Candidatus Woesearchaeota archaeon]